MAYLDPQQTHKRLAGATGVALVHIALAFGLVAGLTVKYVKPVVIDDPTTFDVPVTPPPPPEVVPDPNPVIESPPQAAPNTVVDPIIDIGQATPDFVSIELPPFQPSIGIVAPIIEIGPVAPAFTAQPPRPSNGPLGWVTNNDYPQRALQRGWEGDLTYALEIGTDGRVDDCRIVNSSGRSVLDETACRMISQRARFDPAIDSSGEAIAGIYRGAVSWMIPED